MCNNTINKWIFFYASFEMKNGNLVFTRALIFITRRTQ